MKSLIIIIAIKITDIIINDETDSIVIFPIFYPKILIILDKISEESKKYKPKNNMKFSRIVR